MTTNGSDRVGSGVAPLPPTPPDMRVRIRRFTKQLEGDDTAPSHSPALADAKKSYRETS